VAWKVKVKDLDNWDLDIKNPNVTTEEVAMSTTEIIDKLRKSIDNSRTIINELGKLLK
jgi:type I restriction enzyme M protein